jgi:hypothetical protein
MKHDTRIKFSIESPHFPYIGRPGLNVDIQDSNDPVEYFKLLIVTLISRETSTCLTGFRKHV